ncbi:hypothetical protein [Aliamphritea hakodatensis]|uniref:hypothetical protein n=1 Tax=Aliamphritea hakodatensis TaxID=2895352 RepID=UPI0022FD838C|nr:hypothetical protein [Aliamphritea hakodatensis]
MNYYSPAATVVEKLTNTLTSHQHHELLNEAQCATESCVLVSQYINEIALECDFSEVSNPGQKLAEINLSMAELTRAFSSLATRLENAELLANQKAA